MSGLILHFLLFLKASALSFGRLGGLPILRQDMVVHDVPNVVVSDASCFTTNSEKNPTLTAMALSSRAAHRLADDLKAG